MSTEFDAALFEAVGILLAECGSALHASELHGTLCGLYCADDVVSLPTWLSHCDAAPPIVRDDGVNAFDTVFAATCAIDTTYVCPLLLPDDSAAYGDRASALRVWASGWLYGFTCNHGNPNIHEDVRDFYTHMQTLAALRIDSSYTASEVDEADYAELIEFIRVGVPLCRSHYQTA